MRARPAVIDISDQGMIWGRSDDVHGPRPIALGPGPVVCAAADAVAVILDDDWALGGFMGRVWGRMTGERVVGLHCVDSEGYRRLLRQLAREHRPVVVVSSDKYHLGGHDGYADLAFLADAPCDFTFGGVRASAVPRVMCSGHPEIETRAPDVGAAPFVKPASLDALGEVVRQRVLALADAVRADLVLERGDYLQGAVTWGPRARAEASLAGLERVLAAWDSPWSPTVPLEPEEDEADQA